MDAKFMKLTKEGQTYHLAIYELGKDPSVISWEIGRRFLKVTIPGLCEEHEVSVGNREYKMLMSASKSKQRGEQRLTEALTFCLRYAELLMREKAGS